MTRSLFAIQSPSIFSIAFNNDLKQEKINYILRDIPMKQFEGVTVTDSLSIASVINFNYHLTNGNMEEAFKSIKHLNSAEIWKNMAEMSVKMKRIDVAETCFSNMKFARGAKALREMEAQNADKDSKIASVAILLNLVDDAERILTEAKRFDQLNNLYQLRNEWEKAIRIAEHEDRINLKNTYFKAAKNFEQQLSFQEAIKYYELSETHIAEVPRMLSENDQIPLLLEYAEKVQDRDIYTYIGKVYEQFGEVDEAKNFYSKANNQGALARICLARNDVEAAEIICNNTSDSLACFWVGKHHEDTNENGKAIMYYKKGRHYIQAIRIAKAGGDDEEVYASAVSAPPYVQAKTAKHFEQRGFIEKAVILHMKGGSYKKALRLAMDNNLTEYIQQITSLVDKEKTDPESMKNLGDMYVDQGDTEKAFGMYVGSGQTDKAIELLEQHNIPLTSEACKKLIPVKGATEADSQRREKVIGVLARRLKEQGKFVPAASLFMEINQPIEALKSTILGGDPEKVAKFANQARLPEAYVLAANFLQNQDWQRDENLMKNIIAFYTKAKKFDLLSNFFVSCAMVEIDDHKNYQKALAALDAAKKVPWDHPERREVCRRRQDTLARAAHGPHPAVRRSTRPAPNRPRRRRPQNQSSHQRPQRARLPQVPSPHQTRRSLRLALRPLLRSKRLGTRWRNHRRHESSQLRLQESHRCEQSTPRSRSSPKSSR